MAILRSTSPCPAEVLDWIAWYGEPDLPAEIRSTIDRHAAECLACRQELTSIGGEAQPEGGVPEGERILERLLRRTRAASSSARAASSSASRAGTERGSRAVPKRRMRSGLAAAAALLLLAGGAWLATGVASDPEPLHTATSGAPSQVAGPALEVIFRDDVPWAQVRDLLAQVGAELGHSPASTAGQVHLALVQGVDPQTALVAVRESGLTIFAERAAP